MSVESSLRPRTEPLNNYSWLLFDPKKGAPFNIVFPITNPGVIFKLDNKDALISFSRFTLGRKKNPNFGQIGSGLEGHLCALDSSTIKDFLMDLQNTTFRMIKQDVGTALLDRFLTDPGSRISFKFLESMRSAFDIILAKSRAVRGMTNKGRYFYNKDGEMVMLNAERVQRSAYYELFIYSAPPVIDWTISPREKGTLGFDQQVKADLFPSLQISVETIGNDIGSDPQFKLLAEIGRFAHPTIPLIRNNL